MNSQANVKAIGKIGDDWRRWIAENLVLGSPPQALQTILVQNGISAGEARHEIELAIQSPYLHGSKRLANRLNKRNWVLANFADLVVYEVHGSGGYGMMVGTTSSKAMHAEYRRKN